MKLIVDGKARRISHEGTISSLLGKLRVRREEVVVKLNGRLAPETSGIGAKDKVEIIKVVFGG